jgi:hypothetical protein
MSTADWLVLVVLALTLGSAIPALNGLSEDGEFKVAQMAMVTSMVGVVLFVIILIVAITRYVVLYA